MLVWLSKMVLTFDPGILHGLAEASKRKSKGMHLWGKSVTNVIWLLLPIFDLPSIMIGPCDLLSVVSHQYAHIQTTVNLNIKNLTEFWYFIFIYFFSFNVWSRRMIPQTFLYKFGTYLLGHNIFTTIMYRWG